jgi:hypothetical protein
MPSQLHMGIYPYTSTLYECHQLLFRFPDCVTQRHFSTVDIPISPSSRAQRLASWLKEVSKDIQENSCEINDSNNGVSPAWCAQPFLQPDAPVFHKILKPMILIAFLQLLPSPQT